MSNLREESRQIKAVRDKRDQYKAAADVYRRMFHEAHRELKKANRINKNLREKIARLMRRIKGGAE